MTGSWTELDAEKEVLTSVEQMTMVPVFPEEEEKSADAYKAYTGAPKNSTNSTEASDAQKKIDA